uniref:Uncharacterized protein n=1 Tax=Rhizophora mucronata TaxID=61149 RepID=A0A2P2PMF6_RHIMU
MSPVTRLKTVVGMENRGLVC